MCLTLCDTVNCSMPGFSVLHYLPEFAQTHVHWVSDATQCHPSHPRWLRWNPHTLLLPSIFPTIRSFLMRLLFISGGQVLEFQLQYQSSQWIVRVDFLLDFLLDSSLLSKELSRVLSSTTFENVSSSVFSLLYGPTFTFIHDYWKNYSFDYMDLCWQIDVSAFQYTVRWFVITILPRSSSLSQINISQVEFMIPFLWSSKMSPNQ